MAFEVDIVFKNKEEMEKIKILNRTVIIEKITIHNLNMEEGQINYSKGLIDLSQNNTDYYDTKVSKCLDSDQIKEIIISEEHHLLNSAKVMSESDLAFIQESQRIANDWFYLCKQIEEMPNFDLMFAQCNINGIKHLLILKLNYKTQPVCIVEDDIYKIVTRQVVPTKGGQVDEAVIINIEEDKLSIIEKKFKIDGKPGYYLNEQYIKGEPKLTDKQKLKILISVVKKINRDYGVVGEDILAALHKTILELTMDDDILNIYKVTSNLFNNDYEANNEAELLLTDMGILEGDVICNIKSLDKMSRCKLKLNDDRIVELDLNDYIEAVDIEKILDENGKKQIVIKNIDDIMVA